jgi:hypothetical protein
LSWLLRSDGCGVWGTTCEFMGATRSKWRQTSPDVHAIVVLQDVMGQEGSAPTLALMRIHAVRPGNDRGR